ncbi:peptidyl-prolyl cis-trans isomerase FKBP4-like isoform X2 [Arapaima gigas]
MRAEEVKGTREAPLMMEMDGEDITPKQDRGVLKLIKKEGCGTELPMTGDKVYVHYTGTFLDGTQFESSCGQEEKFCFELGKGEVIKAWDLGIATMKAGEVSQFICKPEYAYGQSGSPPKIPPSATLVFEVELFKFHGEDVTEDEDGGIVRRIITRGGGHCKPSEGTSVEVTVEGVFGGGAFDRRQLKFTIGYGENLGLPMGVERAIMSMEEGEESLFILSPKYGFGKAGNPPGATLQYRIKLVEFERAKESWEMSAAEKVEESGIAKERGAQFFKEGKFRAAVVQYKRILAWLARESDGQRVRSLRLAAHLNLAVCYLKMREPTQAVESCNQALELDDGSEKALFRRAEACFAMGEFERARDDLRRVLQLYPANTAARARLLLCQRRVKEQRETDKRLYAGLFRKCPEATGKEEEEEEDRGRDQKAA